MKSEIEVPDGWEVTKLGELFTLEYGKGLTKKDRDNGTFPVYGSNGIVGYHSKCLFKGPSIIVGRKGTIGAIVWSDLDAWAIDTTYYIQLKKKELDMKWLFYKLNSLNLSKLNMATGIPGLNRNLVYSKSTALPPLPEQQKIAEILSKVDEQIQQTEEIIEKTEELKKGLMQKLLTKGIRHTRFKQTELGEIPEEWEVVKLRNICNINPYYKLIKGNEYDYIPMEAVLENFGGIAKYDRRIYGKLSGSKFKRNDIIFAKITPCTENGKVAFVENISTEFAIGSTEFIVFSSDSSKVIPQYLFRLLTSYRIHSKAVSSMEGTTGRQRVKKEIFSSISVILPNIKEQQKITAIFTNLDGQLKDNHDYLLHLRQLKKGLMQDLLTGRVRVTV